MDKFYLTVDQKISQPISQPIGQPKQLTTIKSSEINKSPSPKTLRKNISNENFIKFQWPWLL